MPIPDPAKKPAPAKAKAARKPSATAKPRAKAKRAKKPPHRQMTVELADKRATHTVGNQPFDSVAFLRTLR